MTDIYLSPHHDDVCFSLGWTALGRPGGHLVNLFSRSHYTARGLCSCRGSNRMVKLICRAGLVVDRISRLRVREDQAFAAHCRLTRHDLGLGDALLSGRPIWDSRGLEAEVLRLETRLVEFLRELGDREGLTGGTLYCPIGIGGHRDHVATMMAVMKAHDWLRERQRVVFYEDLHYASQAQARADGLDRFRRLSGGRAIGRHASVMSPGQFEDKMRLVALYASQHGQPPDPAAYTPAGSEVQGPHEAFWEIIS